MNPDPDYSAAYLTIRTDAGDSGHGFVFTIGRGNDVQVAAIDALAPLVGASTSTRLLPTWAGFSQPRLRLPAALARARKGRHAHGDRGGRSTRSGIWPRDGPASRCGSSSRGCRPTQIVDLVDFRYLTDALTPRRRRSTSCDRRFRAAQRGPNRSCSPQGYPAYTTDARLARLLRREAGPSGRRGGGRRLRPDQAKGRRRPC